MIDFETLKKLENDEAFQSLSNRQLSEIFGVNLKTIWHWRQKGIIGKKLAQGYLYSMLLHDLEVYRLNKVLKDHYQEFIQFIEHYQEFMEFLDQKKTKEEKVSSK